MANIGSAYLTIFPSMDGFGAKLTSELNGVDVSAIGDKLGDQLGDGISDGMNKATKGASGFSGKLSALAGVAAGVASELAGRLFDAVLSLGSEMVDASDSAQKFASTLEFAEIDSGTIEKLTASTQKYADQTIYDLSDIRNVTAQLASNGVKDYAALAEAVGNLNAVAGGNADTFKSVSMVMTQTAGMQKLTTENWNQMAEAIPGASGALQDAMREAGAFEGNFREAMENGEISADEFFAAVQKLGMTDVAKEAATSTSTIEGATGNLVASVVGVGAQLIDAFKPFITGGISQLATAISQIPALFQQVAAAAAPAFQPVATALQSAGTALTPLIEQLGGSFMGLMQSLGPVIQVVATYLGTWWAMLVNIGSLIAQTFIPILTQVIAFVSERILPAVTPVMDFLLTGVTQLAEGLFSAIEDCLAGISQIWNAVWPAIEAVLAFVMEAIRAVVTGDMSGIEGIISSALSLIKGIWDSIWGKIRGFFSDLWDGIRSAAESGISSVFDTVAGLKDDILGFFSGAGQWLVSSGKALLQGFVDGILGGLKWAGDQIAGGLEFLRGLFPFSPAKRGPFSGHGYTTYSGRALMEDFGRGIASAGSIAVRDAMGAVSDVRAAFSTAASPLVTAAALQAGDGALGRGDSTYNVYIDGASLSSDGEIRESVLELISLVARRKGMGEVTT